MRPRGGTGLRGAAAASAPGSDSGQPSIRIAGLSKRFPGRRKLDKAVTAIEHLNLDVANGEVVALLGPSGCGKTTTLRCVAGLESPDEGQIQINGAVAVSKGSGPAVNVPPERRNLGMVFQSYALWPHLTVHNNVAYPLTARKRPSTRNHRDVVNEILELVGCQELSARYPGELSGGQQQRVALARALVSDSSVILFDEPLSNLDARLRESMRFELVELQQRVGFSALYVTHDQSEAMAVASKIAVMLDGRIQQSGSPADVYNTPASARIASFLGAPEFLDGSVLVKANHTSGVTVSTEIGVVHGRLIGGAVSEGAKVTVCIRPERLSVREVSERPSRAANSWEGSLKHAAFLGSHEVCLFDINGRTLRADIPLSTSAALQIGKHGPLSVEITQEDLLVFSGDAADVATTL